MLDLHQELCWMCMGACAGTVLVSGPELIDTFVAALESSFQRGIVLHTGTLTYPLGERIWATPIAQLWR